MPASEEKKLTAAWSPIVSRGSMYQSYVGVPSYHFPGGCPCPASRRLNGGFAKAIFFQVAGPSLPDRYADLRAPAALSRSGITLDRSPPRVLDPRDLACLLCSLHKCLQDRSPAPRVARRDLASDLAHPAEGPVRVRSSRPVNINAAAGEKSPGKK